MNEQISRLMDGEIDASEVDAACVALKGDAAMATWSCYHTIGDALRGETAVTRSVAVAVARQLAQEPTVLAPRPRAASAAASWAWAVAASVAAVTVVGWTAYSMVDATPAGLAKVREARRAAAPADHARRFPACAPGIRARERVPGRRSVPARRGCKRAVAPRASAMTIGVAR